MGEGERSLVRRALDIRDERASSESDSESFSEEEEDAEPERESFKAGRGERGMGGVSKCYK